MFTTIELKSTKVVLGASNMGGAVLGPYDELFPFIVMIGIYMCGMCEREHHPFRRTPLFFFRRVTRLD